MTDDLNVQKKDETPMGPRENGFGNQISDTPQKSPLEEASSTPDSAPETPGLGVSQNQDIAEPQDSPSDQTPSEETAQAPDTDEFLKSILDEKNPPAEPAPSADSQPVSSEPPKTAETPIVPELHDAPAQNDNSMGLNQPTPPEAPTPQALTPETPAPGDSALPQPPDLSTPDTGMAQEAPIAQSPNEPPQEPKIKDEIGNLDGIVSSQKDNPDKPASSDIFSAPKNPGTPKSSSLKLILFVGVALIVVAAGYIGISKLFSKPSTTTDLTSLSGQTSVAEITQSATAAIATPDQQRKEDLKTIQQALLNYYAAHGQYPIAAEIVMLGTSGNILEKELVPSYLNKIPADPIATKNYAYKSDGTTFILSAVLDDATDSEGVVEGGLTLYKVTNSTTTTQAASSTGTTDSSSSVDNASSSTLPTSATGL
ncbi:MAG: hypothetical protein NTZ65_03940 [Candidatus Berkelbacteria bacterium]|nr:hypothetical protein [Candidatus Berkelbacteria bacterium]